MKKNMVILSILLIAVAICAIGVGNIRNKKNEKLVHLSQQYRQKKLDEAKTSIILENKIASDETKQAIDSSEAMTDEEKIEQEKIDRMTAENPDVSNQPEIAENQSIVKVAFDKAQQEAIRVEGVRVANLAKIKAANLAKIEADKLAKIKADALAKEEADKLAKEAAAKEQAIKDQEAKDDQAPIEEVPIEEAPKEEVPKE